MTDRTKAEMARTQAFILAGGQGERLQPLTESRPKPAVSFGGSFRILDFTLSNCFHSGVSRVALLTQCGHEEIVQYLNEGWNDLWSDLQTRREPLRTLRPAPGKSYRGTADAVFQNRSLLLEDETTDHVLVLSGDHVYQMDYRDLLRQHLKTGADLTIATVECPLRDASHFGIVAIDDRSRVVGFEEKPAKPRPLPARPSRALVSMGVYVFRKSALLNILEEYCGSGLGYDFGHDIIPALIHSGRTFAYHFHDEVQDTPRYWRDIGTLDGYYETSMDLVRSDSPFDPYANDGWPGEPTRHPALRNNTEIRLSPRMGRNCDVSGSVLSAGVHVEENSCVLDSILLPGVRIGKGVRLRRVIIEEGVHVPAGFEAGFDIERDRIAHIVTSRGVVVISQASVASRPSTMRASLRTSPRWAASPSENVRALAAAR
jgi:glucose-1-phosphate adenylyltransferase